MTISAKTFGKKTFTFTMKYDGDEAEISYRPDVLTPKVTREIAQRSADAKEDSVLSDLLVLFVAKWDVVDEDGNAIPISRDALDDLSGRFQVELSNQIQADLAERTEAEGKAGGSSSRLKAV